MTNTKIMKITTQIKPNTNLFHNWYYSLPASQYGSMRKRIMEKCKITDTTFYNWINGKNNVPESAQIVINHIAGIEVFPGKNLN